MTIDTVRDSIAFAISLTLDAECKSADKDAILDALDTAQILNEEQEEELERLHEALNLLRLPGTVECRECQGQGTKEEADCPECRGIGRLP